MKRDMKVYLNDILGSISAIEEYTGTIAENEFYSNGQVQDAVMRRLEIIGEAAKNVDDDFRNQHPDIPWKKIAGLRDVLIHGYAGVKMERIWNVIKTDLPTLKQQILQLLNA